MEKKIWAVLYLIVDERFECRSMSERKVEDGFWTFGNLVNSGKFGKLARR